MIVQRKGLPFSGLGQETVVRPAVSYQEAFDAAFSTCAAMLGEEECRRMMGYIPSRVHRLQSDPYTPIRSSGSLWGL